MCVAARSAACAGAAATASRMIAISDARSRKSTFGGAGKRAIRDHGVPVQLPGATIDAVAVRPGDFILADEDGAIVIPAAVASHVLDRAEALGMREAEIRRAIASGLSLADALTRFGHV